MADILEVKNLKTYFITKEMTVKAVDNVSFTIRQGETFALVGESGCGKSATCRSILRLIHKPGKIVDGHILYKGKELTALSQKEMRQIRGKEIAMIFQEPMTALNPVLTIGEQIFEAFGDQKMSKKEKTERAIELLHMVGIPRPETRIKEYPHQFSGGMRQRAMIAIALAAKPQLLLADEPTTALDVTIQDQIINLLNDLKAKLGMSILLITHDLGVVAQMCNRVAVMYAGHVVEIADTLTLFSSPRHPYTYGLLSSLPTGHEKERLIPIPGSPPDLANPPQGCPFAPRCRFAEDRCREELPALSEISPDHLTRCHFPEKLSEVKSFVEGGR